MKRLWGFSKKKRKNSAIDIAVFVVQMFSLCLFFFLFLLPVQSWAVQNHTRTSDVLIEGNNYSVSIPDGALEAGEQSGVFTRTFSGYDGITVLSEELVFDTTFITSLNAPASIELEWSNNLVRTVSDESRIRVFKLIEERNAQSGALETYAHAFYDFELLENGIRFEDQELTSYFIGVDGSLPTVTIAEDQLRDPAFQQTLPLDFTLEDNVANLRVSLLGWSEGDAEPHKSILPVGAGVRNIRTTISGNKLGSGGYAFQLQVEDGTDTVWSKIYEMYYPRPAVRSLKAHRGGEYGMMSLPVVMRESEIIAGVNSSNDFQVGAQVLQVGDSNILQMPMLDASSMQAFLEDSLTEYDGESWRAFVNDQEDFVEINTPLAEEYIKHSRAVWLHSGSTDLRFNIDSGYHLPLLHPIQMQIQPGWNVISSPWPEDMHWGAVKASSDSSNFAEVSGPWLWDNQNNLWSDPDTTLSIPSFQGALVYNHARDTLELNVRGLAFANAKSDAGERGIKMISLSQNATLNKTQGDHRISLYVDSVKQFELVQTLGSGLSRSLPKMPQLSSRPTILQLQHNEQILQKLWSSAAIVSADAKSTQSGRFYLQAHATDEDVLAVYLYDTEKQTAILLPAYAALHKESKYQVVVGDSALVKQHLQNHQIQIISGESVSSRFSARITPSPSGVHIYWNSTIPANDWNHISNGTWVLEAWNTQGQLLKILWQGSPDARGAFVPLAERWLRSDVHLQIRVE